MAVKTKNTFFLQDKIISSFKKSKAGVQIEEQLLSFVLYVFRNLKALSLKEETAYD